jgi:hypothetical protein
VTAIGIALALVAALQAPARTHVLVVGGVGGEPGYAEAFVRQAGGLVRALETRFAIPATAIVWLAEDPARDPRINGRASRERVEAELLRIAGSAAAHDRLLMVLVGHGSDSGEPRFNLPGPDLSANDLARLLERLPTQAVALVNAASASGGFVDRLQRANRLVITATKSGFERNETMFADAFGRAFAGDAADTDKDGGLSLLEAFTYADREVARRYESENRLRTEHARVSDENLARRFVFLPAGAAVAADDPATAALLERKRDLEARIEALRGRKAAMDGAAYERELEDLLVELARTNQAIRQRGEKKP